MIDNATLFRKSWFEEGVVTIKDVLNLEGNFLWYEEFRNKFNITTNHLYYFQIISAIPFDCSNSLIVHAALTQPEHLILVRWMSLETQ